MRVFQLLKVSLIAIRTISRFRASNVTNYRSNYRLTAYFGALSAPRGARLVALHGSETGQVMNKKIIWAGAVAVVVLISPTLSAAYVTSASTPALHNDFLTQTRLFA